MRALVTGANGFAGTHLCAYLANQGHDVHAPLFDVRYRDAVIAGVCDARPDTIYHLAAQAFVPRSLEDPAETYDINIAGTANLLAAMRTLRSQGQRVRLVYVSSADVYGKQDDSAFPLTERALPNPQNPYAASKLAAEALILGEVASGGVDAVIARPFNHIGPGQDVRFAVASFAAQLAEIAGGGAPVMHVGNLTAKRDFVDVRDVVRAYALLAEHGSAGEVYNICSGGAISMREVLGELIRIAHVPVEVRDDPARMRPADVPLMLGSNAKLAQSCGWAPQIPLRQSLQDVYAGAQMSCAS